MSIAGVILQLAYGLRRHSWLEWSLARWLGVLLLTASLGSLLIYALRPWFSALFGGLLLTYLLVLAWASQCRYIHFKRFPYVEPVFRHLPKGPPLRVEEPVPVRASGWFTVEGKNRYFVNLEADFQTLETREHIILGRVMPTRFMILGEWASYELGWWYIFFLPPDICEMDVGYLTFGAQPALAIRVVYGANEEAETAIHLSFEDPMSLQRVWDDLLLDAPADAAPPADGGRLAPLRQSPGGVS